MMFILFILFILFVCCISICIEFYTLELMFSNCVESNSTIRGWDVDANF